MIGYGLDDRISIPDGGGGADIFLFFTAFVQALDSLQRTSSWRSDGFVI